MFPNASGSNAPMEFSRRQRVYALVGILIALLWPSLVRLLTTSGMGDLSSVNSDLRTIAVEWSIALLLAAIALAGQRLQPPFFRLAMFGGRDVLAMIAALLVTFTLAGGISRFVAPPAFDLKAIASVPFGVRAILVITAGICEEFIFRGFAIEEIGLLTGSRWLGAVLTVVFFGLGHVGTYGFSSALVLPAFIGLVITLLYMWRNNLPLCMLMHAAIDGMVVLLVPALQRAQ